MTAPEMNVLLEEAAPSCSALAGFAAAAAAAAGELVEHAQALGLKAAQEAQRLHREYSEAIDAIKYAAEEAGRAGEAAVNSVESVCVESAKAGSALKDMLVAVEGDAYHFGEERGRVFHDFDESAHEVDAGLQEIAARVEMFEEHITGHVKDAEEALKHVLEVIEQVGTRMVEARRHLQEKMEELGQEGMSRTKQVAEALDQSVSAIAQGFVKFANEGITGHNAVVEAVRQLYLDETKDDPEPEQTYVWAAFEVVRGALEAFQVLPDAALASLQAPIQVIVDEGEKAVTRLSDTDRNLKQSIGMVTR